MTLKPITLARASFDQHGVVSQPPSKSRHLISKVLELDVWLYPRCDTDLCRGTPLHIRRGKTEKYRTLLSREIGGSSIDEDRTGGQIHVDTTVRSAVIILFRLAFADCT